MITVHTDIKVTRRKRLHMVMDGTGLLMFSAGTIIEVLDFLYENEHLKARFSDENISFFIEFRKLDQ